MTDVKCGTCVAGFKLKTVSVLQWLPYNKFGSECSGGHYDYVCNIGLDIESSQSPSLIFPCTCNHETNSTAVWR